MHLSGANMATLWLDLWHGGFDCASTDNKSSWHWAVFRDRDTWEAHGLAVAACKAYLPGSFDVAPRNPCLHANSWYKATEYITWIYNLCPTLLYGVLPDRIWRNFCQFVAGLRIMSQYSITPSQLRHASRLISDWAPEFKRIFYQRRIDRIPFVRPCIHLTCHLPSEATRVGSPICSSQWTMERTIGNLGQEIRQPSDPFSNLAQQGIRRCQVNALKAMLPHLDPPENTNPRALVSLSNGYILLAKRDKRLTTLRGAEATVVSDYLNLPHAPRIRRWVHLRLLNGQIARSEFQELQKSPEEIRMARNVKIVLNGRDRIAEVRYYARLVIHAADNNSDDDEELNAPDQLAFDNVTLVTLYSDPHPQLLEHSYGVVASCTKLGEASLQAIQISAIQSVVAMVPHRPVIDGRAEDRYFLAEKMGLEIAHLGVEEDEED
ncbi:hypothetical protein EDD16DRAFT_1487121 [Pisolithus croceorrhizus]|nr:hypothetical protein EDD16DRAFT_1487121 [Pisolithus croceorrhizus]